MTITCPHCAGALLITGRQVGDKVYHARCGNWVMLCRWATGGWYGVKVQPPPKVYRQVDRGE